MTYKLQIEADSLDTLVEWANTLQASELLATRTGAEGVGDDVVSWRLSATTVPCKNCGGTLYLNDPDDASEAWKHVGTSLEACGLMAVPDWGRMGGD